MSGDLATIKSNIEGVRGLVVQLDTKLKQGQADLEAAKADIVNQQKALKDKELALEGDLAKIQDELTKKDAEMADLQSKLDKASSDSIAELDAIRAQLAEKEASIASMEDEIRQISELSGDIKSEMSLVVSPAAAGGAFRSRRKLLQKLLKKRSRQAGRKIRRSRK